MTASYNFIYDEKGVVEYVVLPVKIWEAFKSYIPRKELNIRNIQPTQPNSEIPEKFNPKKYYGILNTKEKFLNSFFSGIGNINLDEKEIDNLRNMSMI